MQITDLGREFIHLVDRIKEYNEAFVKFERCRIENIDMVDDGDPSPSILRSRGWSEEEIDRYDETWYSTYKMRDFFVRNIFNALISRFTTIITNTGDNEIAKDLLTKIVTDQIAHLLSTLSTGYSQDKMNRAEPMHRVSQDLASPIEEDIAEFYHNPDYFLHNHLINNNLKDVIVSLLHLLYLSSPEDEIHVKRMISTLIHDLRYSILQLEQERPTNTRAKNKHSVDLKGDKELLDILERLLRKFTKFICIATDEIPMFVKPI